MAATPIRVEVEVVLSPSSLANSLRDLADKIDPQPPTATAEDLRGAEAEIARLNAVIDNMPYPSDFQNEDLIEKVARVIYEQTGGDMWDREIEPVRERYRKYARAALAAIGGE